MPFYSEVDFGGSRERIALGAGSYGTGKQPGLKILSYIGEKPEKNTPTNIRHSFLVAATRPSRAQLQAAAESGNGHAGSTPFETPDFEGTAFLVVTLSQSLVAPESIALALTEASKNDQGVIQRDYCAKAVEAGEVTEESLQKCRIHFQKVATDKVIAANTPEEGMADAIKAQYAKELQQVQIKVGQFFHLQDWKNKGDKKLRDDNLDLNSLVGTEFSGKVEKANVGDGSEVRSIYEFSGK
jgi:hypothetical protein